MSQSEKQFCDTCPCNEKCSKPTSAADAIQCLEDLVQSKKNEGWFFDTLIDILTIAVVGFVLLVVLVVV